jgi:serine/threonine-protein kinase
MDSGQTIAGKYRLNQLLGTGGMAEVWSATNVMTDRQFAIKFMNPEVTKSKEAAARFMKEAKVSARIDHPNVIDVIDIGQTDEGALFMVMELLTGVTLEVAIRRQQPPMSLHEFAFVMVEVARALAAAHRAGVVHRDLKPTNIFLHKDKNGAAVPKLLDFGVSKFLEEDHNSGLTMAGTVLGSPLYMSPEQARGDVQIDHRSDIFAFGAIMFEALSGQRPFEAPNFNALIVNIATKQPKDIDVCAPQMPESLREIVKLCLETDRNRRAPNLEAVGEMLFAALPGLEQSPLRLPAPRTLLAGHDPDATNALPVVRPSDRPPPSPPTNSAPPPGYAHPWQTPAYASTTFSRKKQQALVWGIAGGAMIFVLLVVAFVTIAIRSRGVGAGNAVASSPPLPATTVIGATGSASGSGKAEPPSINVDALPVANQPLGPVAKGMGRLFIGSSSGWCAISVDGNKKGPTPLPAIDVPTGAHQLRCEPPNGKPTQVANVMVMDGQTARYSFKLEE